MINPLKLTRQVLSLLLGTAFLLLTTVPVPAQVRLEQAKVTIMVGQVEVLRKGATAWQPGRLGMLLWAGDEIRAAQGSVAELAMTDGSVVKVIAGSRLQIRQLESDPSTRARTSWFHLVVGRVRFVVVRAAVILVQARQGRFAISTPTAVAAIRGSDGLISYSPATRTTNVLSFRGVFSVVDLATRRQVFVAQGTISRVQTGRPPTTPAPVPANIQAAVLQNAPILTPAPAASPVTAPVAAQTAAAQPATPVAGASPTAPPPPPPLAAADIVDVIPPPSPSAAPAPPPTQAPVIALGIPAVPLAPPAPTPTEAAAESSAFAAATSALPPAPPVDLLTQATIPPVPPQIAAVPPSGTPPPTAVPVVAALSPTPVPVAPSIRLARFKQWRGEKHIN